MIDWSKVKWPEEYAKPILVVPDDLVEAFEKMYPYARVIPVSETRLPESESDELRKAE